MSSGKVLVKAILPSPIESLDAEGERFRPPGKSPNDVADGRVVVCPR